MPQRNVYQTINHSIIEYVCYNQRQQKLSMNRNTFMKRNGKLITTRIDTTNQVMV